MRTDLTGNWGGFGRGTVLCPLLLLCFTPHVDVSGLVLDITG